jgi:hypothetical protein
MVSRLEAVNIYMAFANFAALAKSGKRSDPGGSPHGN